jgi:hypothetical protein
MMLPGVLSRTRHLQVPCEFYIIETLLGRLSIYRRGRMHIVRLIQIYKAGKADEQQGPLPALVALDDSKQLD